MFSALATFYSSLLKHFLVTKGNLYGTITTKDSSARPKIQTAPKLLCTLVPFSDLGSSPAKQFNPHSPRRMCPGSAPAGAVFHGLQDIRHRCSYCHHFLMGFSL